MTCVSFLLMGLVKLYVRELIFGYVFISRICFLLCCFHFCSVSLCFCVHELVAPCKTPHTWHFLRHPLLRSCGKTPCVHLELLKGHCKYGVLITGLFLFESLSNLPGARACSWRTVLHLCWDLMASLFAFSLKKRGFIPLVVSHEDFSWLKKQALCWTNVFQFSMFKHCKLEQM